MNSELTDVEWLGEERKRGKSVGSDAEDVVHVETSGKLDVVEQ